MSTFFRTILENKHCVQGNAFNIPTYSISLTKYTNKFVKYLGKERTRSYVLSISLSTSNAK